MKQNPTLQIMGWFLSGIVKKSDLSSQNRKCIRREYQSILSRSKDIGKTNPLLSAYALGAWFIAMNRMGTLTPEENYRILETNLRNSRMFRMVMGDADHYLSPKRIQKQQKWSEQTHRHLYENDWVADVLPGNKDFDLGYDYLECGICKMCRQEGCPEMAQYLCRLDFLFAEVMGLHLERTTTLAQGGPRCDFRFSRISPKDD